LEIEPQIELVGEEIETVEQNVDMEPLVSVQLGLLQYSKGNRCFKKYRILSFHFCHFTKILGTKSKVQRG
jgi:hypothetical protein